MESKDGKTAALTGEDFVHARALRLKTGEEVAAVESGRAYLALVESASKSEIFLSLKEPLETAPEPNLRVTLYQALPKASKMETVIQKCVELGVYAICPLVMARCVAEPDNQKKPARWRRIAKEAAMQSGRLIVPEVALPVPLAAAKERMKEEELLLVPYEDAKSPGIKDVLSGALGDISRVGVIIGPEGGMAPGEAKPLSDIGGKILSLGPRILRTETAGLCVLSALMYEAGEMEWR